MRLTRTEICIVVATGMAASTMFFANRQRAKLERIVATNSRPPEWRVQIVPPDVAAKWLARRAKIKRAARGRGMFNGGFFPPAVDGATPSVPADTNAGPPAAAGPAPLQLEPGFAPV